MTNREKAMIWWNNLSSAEKTQICDTNTELIGYVRRWERLTGREIQTIWAVKMNHPEHPETIKDDDKEIEELEKDLWNQLTGTPPIKEQSNSVVSISLEDALRKQFNNVGYDSDDAPLHLYLKGGEFAASILKEQYKELLSAYRELLEALQRIKSIYDNVEDAAGVIAKEAIQKATTILNQLNK